MSIVRLTKDERALLRTLYQDGSVKVGERENPAFCDVATDLQAKGFIRAVRSEEVADDSAYVVLTGRGLITIESVV